MHRLLIATIILLTPLAAASTDVSGKWSGSLDRPTDNGLVESTPIVAEFQQEGSKLTGTVGALGQPPLAVEKGTVDGDKLTFEAHAPNGTYVVRLSAVSASELKGETTFTENTGRTGTAPLKLSRN